MRNPGKVRNSLPPGARAKVMVEQSEPVCEPKKATEAVNRKQETGLRRKDFRGKTEPLFTRI